MNDEQHAAATPTGNPARRALIFIPVIVLGALALSNLIIFLGGRGAEQETYDTPLNAPTNLTAQQQEAIVGMCLERTRQEFGEANYWPKDTPEGTLSPNINDFGYIVWTNDVVRLSPSGDIEADALVRCQVSPQNLNTIADFELM